MFRKGIAVLMGTCMVAGVLGGCSALANTGETKNMQGNEHKVQRQKHPMKNLIMPYLFMLLPVIPRIRIWWRRHLIS